MSTVQFDDVFHANVPVLGTLKIAPSGFGWKSSENDGGLVLISSSDLKWFQWLRVARNFQLRIGLKGEKGKRRETFEGFKSDDFERLRNIIKQHFDLDLENREVSLRGWNWGKFDVQATDIAFFHSGQRLSFEIPLDHVHNAVLAKSDVTLEFLNPEGDQGGDKKSKKSKKQPDQIVEMRLYIPGTTSRKKRDSEAGSENEDEPDADGDVDMEEESAAQVFHDLITDRAEIGRVTGDQIVTLPDVLCLTPRGRFDMDLCSTFLRLRGKTYDYKILYTTVKKLFLLPKPDDVHIQFVLNLDPPIRQGQTRYPYLVMQFGKDEEMDAELNLDENELKEKWDGALQKSYQAPAHEVVSMLFRVLTGRKVTTPGGFQSRDGQSGVKCNMKANEGHIYFLEKSIIFISRQPMYLPFSEISSVHFSRVGGALQSSRTFDLQVHNKSSTNFTFSSLGKEEFQHIEEFLQSKKIKVKNEIADDAGTTSAAVAAALLSDEDEDMDDASDASGGGGKKQKGAPGNDDSDEEEDEDFSAGSSDSDVGEEYDSNYGGSSSEGEEEASPPKKKKKAREESSGDEEGPSRKKAKKS